MFLPNMHIFHHQVHTKSLKHNLPSTYIRVQTLTFTHEMIDQYVTQSKFTQNSNYSNYESSLLAKIQNHPSPCFSISPLSQNLFPTYQILFTCLPFQKSQCKKKLYFQYKTKTHIKHKVYIKAHPPTCNNTIAINSHHAKIKSKSHNYAWIPHTLN